MKEFNYNETVEIVFQGTNLLDAAEAHPMHLHGYAFYVVGTGVGIFDPENDPKSYNLVDPPYLNTVWVPKEGWAVVRFVTSNPGNNNYIVIHLSVMYISVNLTQHLC